MFCTIIIIIINNKSESVWVEGKGMGRVREGETSAFFFGMYLLLYIKTISTPHSLTLLTSSSTNSLLNDTSIYV